MPSLFKLKCDISLDIQVTVKEPNSQFVIACYQHEGKIKKLDFDLEKGNCLRAFSFRCINESSEN